jgi:hypothetical protein
LRPGLGPGLHVAAGLHLLTWLLSTYPAQQRSGFRVTPVIALGQAA